MYIVSQVGKLIEILNREGHWLISVIFTGPSKYFCFSAEIVANGDDNQQSLQQSTRDNNSIVEAQRTS